MELIDFIITCFGILALIMCALLGYQQKVIVALQSENRFVKERLKEIAFGEAEAYLEDYQARHDDWQQRFDKAIGKEEGIHPAMDIKALDVSAVELCSQLDRARNQQLNALMGNARNYIIHGRAYGTQGSTK